MRRFDDHLSSTSGCVEVCRRSPIVDCCFDMASVTFSLSLGHDSLELFRESELSIRSFFCY